LDGKFLTKAGGGAGDEDGFSSEDAHTSNLSVWTWMA
jgi:hypothetical protein